MKKRILALVLALTLALSLLPSMALAAGETVSTAVDLKAAIEKAPTDGSQVTITLGADITDMSTDQIVTIAKGQNIVLDMARHSITVDSAFEGRPVRNEGTLTVTGNGIIDSSNSDTKGYGAIDNHGTLTIENGTFTGSVNASGASIKNRPDGVLTIENGTFNGAVTAVYNAGIAKIYNGLFDCRSCSACNNSSWGYTIQSHMDEDGKSPQLYFYDGTVIGVQGGFSTSAGYSEIHDGTFKTVSCDKHSNGSSAHYALYIAGEDEDVKCVVYGGYFESVSKTTALIGNDNTGGDGGINANATTEIKGGTFVAPAGQNAITGAEKTGNPTITGGTFSSDVSKYLSAGYTQDENGLVAPLDESNAVAKVGDTYYETLADAVAAVHEESTDNRMEEHVINLLKSVSGGGFAVGYESLDYSSGSITAKGNSPVNIVIDLGQNTYTIEAPTVGSSGTETNGFQFLKGSSVKIRNGSMELASGVRCAYLFQNYANLTLENISVDISKNEPCEALLQSMHGKVDIIGNTSLISGDTYEWNAADKGTQRAIKVMDWNNSAYAEGTQVTIDTTGTIDGSVYASYYTVENVDVGTEKSTLTIKNGYFTKDISRYVHDNSPDITITGGHFTSNPSAYLGAGKAVVESDRNGYNYMVTDAVETPAEVVPAAPEVALPTLESEDDQQAAEAVKNELEASADLVTGDGLGAAAATEANKNTVTTATEVEEGTTVLEALKTATKDDTLTADDVTIVIQPYMDVQIDSLSTEDKTLTLTITPMYRTVATTADLDKGEEIVVDKEGADAPNAVEIPDAAGELTVTKPVTVTVPLPDGFLDGVDNVYVQHMKGIQLVGYHAAVVDSDANTLTFTNDKGFSTFAIKADARTATVDFGGTEKTLTPADVNSALPTATAPAGQVFSGWTFAGITGTYTTLTEDLLTALSEAYAVDSTPITATAQFYTPVTPPVDPEKPELPFTDVSEGDWYYDAVYYAWENKLMDGMSQTTFEPGTHLSRAMLTRLLYNLEGQPAISGASAFTDVPEGQWYSDAVKWAAALDLVSGYEDGSFQPTKDISRQEMVLLLYNYAEFKGYDLNGSYGLSAFTDGDKVGDWAKAAMEWALANKIISGKGDGVLDPTGTATRAEIAQLFQNFLENYAK